MADKPTEADPEISRRSLLDLLLALGGGIWTVGMAVPAALYLLPARASGPAQSTLSVGPRDSLAVGEARMMSSRGHPIIVIRRSQDEYRAFSAICPHLGCVVQWDAARRMIACPCHAAVFSADGRVISGPPPRGLGEYQVVVIGDEVKIRIG